MINTLEAFNRMLITFKTESMPIKIFGLPQFDALLVQLRQLCVDFYREVAQHSNRSMLQVILDQLFGSRITQFKKRIHAIFAEIAALMPKYSLTCDVSTRRTFYTATEGLRTMIECVLSALCLNHTNQKIDDSDSDYIVDYLNIYYGIDMGIIPSSWIAQFMSCYEITIFNLVEYQELGLVGYDPWKMLAIASKHTSRTFPKKLTLCNIGIGDNVLKFTQEQENAYNQARDSFGMLAIVRNPLITVRASIKRDSHLYLFSLIVHYMEVFNHLKVRLYFQNGVDINSKDANGLTFLSHAIRIWEEDDFSSRGKFTIKLMIANGVNPPLHDGSDLSTDLFRAIDQHDHIRLKVLLMFLKETRGDINMKNMEGHTLLRMSIENQSILCTKILLSKGADGFPELFRSIETNDDISFNILVPILSTNLVNFNTRNSNGDTPLMAAVKMANLTFVAMLMHDRKSDPRIQDAEGITAIQYSCRNNLDDCLAILLGIPRVFRQIEDGICGICMTEQASVVYNPCNHLFSCDACTRLPQVGVGIGKNCPICKSRIRSLIYCSS